VLSCTADFGAPDIGDGGGRRGTNAASLPIQPPDSPSLILATTSISFQTGPTPTQLAQALVGTGVTVSNVTYTGALTAAGAFTGGTGIIGFENGVVLSSGSIHSVPGPNMFDGITTGHGTPGDNALSTLSGQTTLDAAVLEFDFIPNASQIFIQFVFASEEYNEFVGDEFNDVFAFIVNGNNCARAADGSPVTVNSVNLQSNASQFRNNDARPGPIDTEMDGLTVVLTCQAQVAVGVSNRMKLAIADAADDAYDSNVFIRAGSLSTLPPNEPPIAVAGADLNRECTGVNTGVALNGTASSDPDGTITAYRWTRNGVQIATGATPTVSLGLGVHTIVLEVTDNGQKTATDTVIVTIQDTTPPALSLGVSPDVLTPPDHTYWPVSPFVTATELCGGAITYGGNVRSSEPDNAPARDGTTTGDIKVTRPGSVVVFSSTSSPVVQYNPLQDLLELRAERSGAAVPRVYTITVMVTDARGNVRSSTATVTVPLGSGG
jgi:hypothetical protein